MVIGGGRPILSQILGQQAPGWREMADFEPLIIARSASAVRPSEKKFN